MLTNDTQTPVVLSDAMTGALVYTLQTAVGWGNRRGVRTREKMRDWPGLTSLPVHPGNHLSQAIFTPPASLVHQTTE